MKPGPRPLPKNVREIRGARRAPSAVPEEDEIPFVVKIPSPPDYLTPEETDIFVTTARKLADMRVMNESCVDALVIYCRNWITAREASQRLAESGGMILKAPSGYPIVNPFLGIRRKAEDACLRIMCEFGLTPSALTQIKRQ